MRIATFNLKDFFASAPPDVLTSKLANLENSLRRADADVVALQEVGSPELLDDVRTKLGYGTPVVGSADKRGIRNVILSRVPVLWSQVHQAKTLPFPRFFEGDPDPFAGRIPLRRGVVHVRVEGEIDILTLHFKSGLPAPARDANGVETPMTTPHALGEAAVRSLVQRAAEALYVRALVDDIFTKNPDHAVCVLGDFNDELESLPVSIVRGYSEEQQLASTAKDIPRERCFTSYQRGGPVFIDHILVSAALSRAMAKLEIHNEALRDHGPHVDHGPVTPDSDHALCVAEFHQS